MFQQVIAAIKKDSIRSILVLFFFFLLAVEGAGFYLGLQQKSQQQNDQLQYTLDGISTQVSLRINSEKTLIAALLRAHRNELNLLIDGRFKLAMEFEAALLNHLTNYYGFQILNPDGQILYNGLSPRFSDEQTIINEFAESTKQAGSNGAVKLHFHKDTGSVYYQYPLNISDDQWVHIVIARHTDLAAQVLISHQFKGFKLCLENTDLDRLIVGNGQFYDGKKLTAQQSSPCKSNTTLLSRDINKTPWRIYGVEQKNYWSKEIFSLLLPNFIFTLLFLLLSVVITKGIDYSRRKQGLHLVKVNNKSQRAEQALDCINEVVITTSLTGKIIFCNASAGKWLGKKSIESVIGQPIQTIFPFPGMPWVSNGFFDKPSHYTHHGDTLVDFNGNLVTLDISQHCSRINKYESIIIWVLKDITRQANDRELLDLSRARYRAIYEGTGVGMWHIDISLVREWLNHLDGESIEQHIASQPNTIIELRNAFQIIDVNDAALEFHGYSSRHEFLANIQKFFSEHNQDLLVEMASNILADNKKFSLEIDFKDTHGNSAYFLVNVTLDQVGNDQALLSFIDINDRMMAERALKESEQFWASVINTLPDTVYVNDLKNKKTRFNNRHLAELIGYDKSEIKHFDHWRDLVHPDDKQKVESVTENLRGMEPGEISESLIRMKHKDGSWHFMRFRDSVFSQSSMQSSRYYVGMARDVNDEELAKIHLSQSERRYRLLAEGMSDIIFTLDDQLQLTYMSSSVTKMLGYQANDILNTGLNKLFSGPNFDDFMDEIKQDLIKAKESSNQDEAVRTLDLSTHTTDGKRVTLEVQSSILHSEGGYVEGILATCREVTQRRFIEQEARTASEVFENSSEAILVTSADGTITKVNKAFYSLTGFDYEQVLGTSPIEFLAPDTPENFYNSVSDALLVEGYWQGEVSYRNKRGEIRPSWTGITALKDHMGKTLSHIIISSDIAHRKITEARIEHLAYFDPLTGLPNRAQMHETLETLMQEPDQKLALLFIDLDRFKPINDTMGHPVGDQVLKQVAERLSDSIRSEDLVSRIGGDEFTVIMPNMKDSIHAVEQTINVSERILHQIMQPFNIEDRQLYLSASVGIALFPRNAQSSMDLLRNADTAMYHAKAMGKNNFQFYADEMNVKAMERLELENNLHLALRRNEFELHFQAQWNTKENCLCGIETLLRWRRPNYGLVGPDKFIPIIEETGLIVPIGEWVLRATCEQIIEWQENGMLVPKISVNLSARQFKDAQMLERICRIVDETGVDPELIELELTESILMDDVDRTLEVLNEARRMGFGLSIDDFGTGYSSLSYLKQFPVNNLKIDKSFIRNLPHNLEDAQITRTIVAMANNLGLGVIAEGVENPDQRMFLQQVGCHQVQGYMYSHPVSADIFAHDFLESEAIEME